MNITEVVFLTNRLNLNLNMRKQSRKFRLCNILQDNQPRLLKCINVMKNGKRLF